MILRQSLSLFVCVAGVLCFSLPAVQSAEEHPHYCKTRSLRAESDWGRIVRDDKTDPQTGDDETICPDPCYPDCVDPSQLWEYCYTGFCPASLPAPGHGVHLAMVSGAWQVNYDGWEMDVGFGDRRPLNLLSRLYRAANGKTARVFLPSNQQFAEFVLLKDDEYILDAAPSMLPAGSTLNFAANNNGATLLMSDGQRWEFEPAGRHKDGGNLFRKSLAVERRGWTTRYEYGTDRITITDAAGQPYEINFDAARRITRISVAGRDWTYEYAGGVVRESEPSGARTSVAVGPAYRFAGVERDGGALGGRRVTRIEIDEQGTVTGAWDGDRHIGVTETREGDAWRIVVDKDGVKSGMKRTPGGRAWAVNGDDGRASSESLWATRYDVGERVDALGRVTRREHDADGRLTREISPSGLETRHAYDERGNRILKVTPEGAWRYEYDEANYLVATTSPTGAVTRFSYDKAVGKPSRRIDALGNITKYTYDSRGLLLSVVGPFAPDEAEPPARRFEYDAYGNQTAAFDEFGLATRFEYDVAGNVTRHIDALGNATQYIHDGLGRKVKEVDALGGTTEWVYDDRGLMVEVKSSQTGVSGPMAGKTTCGSCGGAAGVYDKPGKYEYNAARLLTKYTDALGNETKYDYNDLGQQVKVIDALGAETGYEYDPVGNLLATTDPLGAVTRHEYDGFGRMTATIDPLGRATRYEYDGHGRQVAMIAPGGATTRTEYDAFGRMTKTIAPNGAATIYDYDVEGRLSRQVNALGVATEFGYDADGRRIATVTDADGLRLITRHAYDAAGRMESSTNPRGHTTRYAYDELGRMAKAISPSGAETKFEYDALGRQIKVTDPAGRMRTMEYAPGGNALAATGRGQGAVLWYEYDELGRRTLTDGQAMPKEKFVYDAVGGMIESARHESVTKMVYDYVGRVVETIDPMGASTKYEYNPAGELTAVTNALGYTTRYEYDEAGRQIKTFLPGGGVRENVYNLSGQLVETRGGPEGVKRYEYDLLNRRVAEINALGGRKTTRYDAAGRVSRIANEMNQPVDYEYDEAGNRTALIDANGNKTVWEYDEDNRQTSMTYANGDREEYKYDASGKLSEKKTPNGEYIRFVYDENGFLTKVDVQGECVKISAPTCVE